MADDWIVRNRETGSIVSSILPEQLAREAAATANLDHQTDAYTAEPWKEHTNG